MRQGKCRLGLFFFVFILTLTSTSLAQQSGTSQRVFIETPKPYDRVIRAIEANGGTVLYQYTYVDGIGAELSDAAIDEIRRLVGTAAITKDVDIALPQPVSSTRSHGAPSQPVAASTADTAGQPSRISNVSALAVEHPEVYSLNNAGTRIERLHALGLTGEGTTVAVIDTGVRQGYKLLLDSVVGGVDFVDDGHPGPSGDSQSDWKQSTNDGHGTFAASLIVGDASFPVTGVLKDALLRYAPNTIVDGKLNLVGTAPDAKIYVVRVFGNTTTGASVLTVMAAIENVIQQRRDYDRTGGRQGLKIDVANLGLGISTLAAGRAPLDLSVDALLNAGIVPVVSSGDTGPATVQISSPGTSMSAITVGGSSRATNERLMTEIQYATQSPELYYPGIGQDVRPFNGTQTAWFSSRGPDADGRLDPDVVASAVGAVGQGYCPDQILEACFKRLSFASGTSFSAPIVAGIAAVLREAFPRATATQIRNAVIASGRTSQIEGYFDDLDRGQGLPDAWAAYQLLASGTVPDTLPTPNIPDDLVRVNIEQNTNLDVVTSAFVSTSMQNLKPGARGEILYDVPQGTERVVVRLGNVSMSGPQNVFFGGDSLFLYIHSARTHSQSTVGTYLVNGELFSNGQPEREFVFQNPDSGIMRITLNPDTLNAGLVSADVSIDRIMQAWPTATFAGAIHDGETLLYTLPVPNGTTKLDFLLTWDHDWAHYPTNDIDLVVCAPNIPSTIADCRALGNKAGATLAGPERATINNPAAGTWTLLVRGFNVPSGTDNFQLRVTETP